MLKKIALVWGIIFVLVGIAGFIPGITTTNSAGMHLLIGLFMVGALHNIIHLATGIVSLATSNSERNARLYFQIFGVIYALVTIIGFIQGDTVLGLFGINMADNFLHLVITLVALYLGFGYPTTAKDSTATTARV